MQRPAKPWTPVRFRPQPPFISTGRTPGTQRIRCELKRIKYYRRWILIVLGVALLRLVSKRISLAMNQRLGVTLVTVVSLFKLKTRKTADTNLALCFPEMEVSDRHRMMRRSFQELGKLVFEADYLWHIGKPEIRALVREVEGEEVRTRAEAQGRGVIYATPHLGCWELAGLYIALDGPLYCLYKRSRYRIVEHFIRGGREAGGLKLCQTDMGGVKKLLRKLAAGENIGILPDQKAPADSRVIAPFFGHPAITMTLLIKLARHAPVVFVYAQRLPYAHGYRICFLEPSPEIYSADPVIAATAVNQAIEHLVRRCPEQYLWLYRRFQLCQGVH